MSPAEPGEREAGGGVRRGLLTVDMATLLTGNGVQTADIMDPNDIIDGTDFSILAGAFFTACGAPDYDDRADYDPNCFIDGTDFSELAGEFFTSGPVPV